MAKSVFDIISSLKLSDSDLRDFEGSQLLLLVVLAGNQSQIIECARDCGLQRIAGRRIDSGATTSRERSPAADRHGRVHRSDFGLV